MSAEMTDSGSHRKGWPTPSNMADCGERSSFIQVEAPRQLPSPPRVFVNRTPELEQVTAIATHRTNARGPAVVVLSGLSGVGKSAFAIHWAHEHINRFDGGQLYVDMSAHLRHGGVEIGEVLGAFLRALGVHADYVPAALPERAALFRSRTADARLLVVVDNADQAAQVRPLIPGSPGSVVIVTSRRRLSGLAMDGAEFVDLRPLSNIDGVSLITRLMPRKEAESERGAVRDLAVLCGGLPIALCIAGANLSEHKTWSVARLVRHLSDDRWRLGRLAVEGDGGVARMFDVAYGDLADSARRTYRLLGLHPGPDFGIDVVASVVDVRKEVAEDYIGALCAANLVEELGSDRYRFHDLVRLHAQQCAERDESPDGREAITRRTVEWYLLGAAAADFAVLGSTRWRIAHHDLRRWRIDFDAASGMRWFEIEKTNILAAMRTASQHEWFDIAWQFCESMWAFYYSRKNYADWVESHELGVTAAQRCKNQPAEIRLRNQLARAHLELGEFGIARDQLEASKELTGNPRAEALILESFGLLYRSQERYSQAGDMFRRACDIHRDIGNDRGVALQSYQLGDVLVRDNRADVGVEVLNQALAIMVKVGDEMALARVKIALGNAYDILKRDEDARSVLRSAVAVTRDRQQPIKEAQALEVLVGVAQRGHDSVLFRASALRLVELYDEAGSPRSAKVRRWIERGIRPIEDRVS